MNYQSVCKRLLKEAGMRKEALTGKGKVLDALQFLLKKTVTPQGKELFTKGLQGETAYNPLQLIGNRLRTRGLYHTPGKYVIGGVRDIEYPIWKSVDIADAMKEGYRPVAPFVNMYSHLHDWNQVRMNRGGIWNNLLKPLKNTRYEDKLNRLIKRLQRRIGGYEEDNMREILSSLKRHLKQNGDMQRAAK